MKKYVKYVFIILGFVLLVASLMVTKALTSYEIAIVSAISLVIGFTWSVPAKEKIIIGVICIVVTGFIYNLGNTLIAKSKGVAPFISIKDKDDKNFRYVYHGLFFRGYECYATTGTVDYYYFGDRSKKVTCPEVDLETIEITLKNGDKIAKKYYDNAKEYSLELKMAKFKNVDDMSKDEIMKALKYIDENTWCKTNDSKDATNQMTYRPINGDCTYVNQDYYCQKRGEYFKSKDGKCTDSNG